MENTTTATVENIDGMIKTTVTQISYQPIADKISQLVTRKSNILESLGQTTENTTNEVSQIDEQLETLGYEA